MQNKIIVILILIILGIVGGGFYLITEKKTVVYENIYLEDGVVLDIVATSTATTTDVKIKEIEQKPEEDIVEDKETSKEFIYFGQKNPGNDIYIDVVFLKQGGFVIAYENTAEPMGELLAISKYLEVGEYFKIPLHLFRETKDGEIFNVMLHVDNGDKVFSLLDDMPVRGDDGEGVYTQLIIKNIIPAGDSVGEKDENSAESDE